MAGTRSPKVAVVLALVFPGLGHLYVGRWGLALVFPLLINPWTLLFAVELSAWLTGDGPHNWWVVLLFVAAYGSQAADAWQMARSRNRAVARHTRRQRR